MMTIFLHYERRFYDIIVRVDPGRLRGLAVACWTTDHYHPCLTPGVGISGGCFVFHFVSLPLEVARPIKPTLCTKVAIKHQSSSEMIQLQQLVSFGGHY